MPFSLGSPDAPINPLPWQMEITEAAGKVIRAQVVDALGAAIITVKSPSKEALANTARLTSAVNATAAFTGAQLDAACPKRAVAALHTIMQSADPTGSINLKPKVMKALAKLLGELPDSKSVK